MYAIIATGGKQYRVTPGMLLDVERLTAEKGAALSLETLAVRTDDDFSIGRPTVVNTTVKAEVVGEVKGPKVIHFTYKRRKGYHRKVGHRQQLTRIKVLEILSPLRESPVAALGSNASNARREEEGAS